MTSIERAQTHFDQNIGWARVCLYALPVTMSLVCDCIHIIFLHIRKEWHFLPILIAQSEKDMDFKVAITITNGPFKFET